jgi:dienelactone hydrolase/predicted MFS family arabinose efflux permease
MHAAVEEHGDAAVAAAQHDDGLQAEGARDVVAGIGNLAVVADEDPAGVEDPLHLVGEDLRIRVERRVNAIVAYENIVADRHVAYCSTLHWGRMAAPRRKLMLTLFVAQVCGSTGHSMSLAVGAIMAAAITGTNTWSGMPVAVGALGAALASWPLSRLMARSGRRLGLAIGYGIAVIGAGLGIVGVTVGSFAVMLVGMTLFGISNTSNLLARYAAADITPGHARGRAMGLIVWGSTLGSIIGPNLMAPALRLGNALGIDKTASAFLVSVGGYAVAAILVALFLRPDPLSIAREMQAADTGTPPAPARTFGEIMGDVRVQIAFATLAIGQFVMISTTSTSPLYLHDQGHGVGTIGVAVALHLGGMYVASPLSGWLCDRFGRMTMIGSGALVLIGSVILAGYAPGSDSVTVIAALFLNGVGWNFAFVAGSALLTDALSPSERASIQGLADLVLGLMGASGSAAGGMILGLWGFAVLNTVGAVLVLAPLAVTLLRRPAVARVAGVLLVMGAAGVGQAQDEIPMEIRKPDGTGPFPAIVIAHDCSGLGSASNAPDRWARELVPRGYVVLIPDSFSTRGFPTGVCTDPSPKRNEVSPQNRVRDVYWALARARALPYVDGARVGIMGGSHGGATTLRAMSAPVNDNAPNAQAKKDGFKAGIALYPGCGDTRARNSSGGVYKPIAPVLILAGAFDDWTPAAPCQKLADGAKAAGYPVSIKVYPATHHSFDNNNPVRFDPMRVNANASGGRGATTGGNPFAWADAKKTVPAFFDQHLKK